jgi:hypothetical protein
VSKPRPGLDVDHSPYIMSRSRMNSAYPPLSFGSCVAVAGQLFFSFYFKLCFNIILSNPNSPNYFLVVLHD